MQSGASCIGHCGSCSAVKDGDNHHAVQMICFCICRGSGMHGRSLVPSTFPATWWWICLNRLHEELYELTAFCQQLHQDLNLQWLAVEECWQAWKRSCCMVFQFTRCSLQMWAANRWRVWVATPCTRTSLALQFCWLWVLWTGGCQKWRSLVSAAWTTRNIASPQSIVQSPGQFRLLVSARWRPRATEKWGVVEQSSPYTHDFALQPGGAEAGLSFN